MQKEYDYEIRILNDQEGISIKSLGTWQEIYEIARSYNMFGKVFSFYNREGGLIVTLSTDQLMDDNLKIMYND